MGKTKTRWSLEGSRGRVGDRECEGAEAAKGESLESHRGHDLERTRTETQDLLLQRVGRLDLHEDFGRARGRPAARPASSPGGHTRPPLPSESLEAELKAGDSPSLALDSLSP